MSAASAGAATTNRCPQCGVSFRCGMAGGDAECWCARLPHVLPLPADSAQGAVAGCLCPACLKDRLRPQGQAAT